MSAPRKYKAWSGNSILRQGPLNEPGFWPQSFWRNVLLLLQHYSRGLGRPKLMHQDETVWSWLRKETIEHMLSLAINYQNIAKARTSNFMHCCGMHVADSKTEVFCKHLTKFSFTGNWAKKRGGDANFWIQNDSEDLIFVFQPACRIPAWKVWRRMTSVHSHCYSSITRFTLNVIHTVTRLFTIQSLMYAHIIIHSHTRSLIHSDSPTLLTRLPANSFTKSLSVSFNY